MIIRWGVARFREKSVISRAQRALGKIRPGEGEPSGGQPGAFPPLVSARNGSRSLHRVQATVFFTR